MKNKNTPPPSDKVLFVMLGPCASTSRCYFAGLGQGIKGSFLSFNHHFYPFGFCFFLFFLTFLNFIFTQQEFGCGEHRGVQKSNPNNKVIAYHYTLYAY